jgi:hypothetical protein
MSKRRQEAVSSVGGYCGISLIGSQELNKKYGDLYIKPFSYDLIYFVEKIISRTGWEVFISDVQEAGYRGNEEGMIDFMMNMTLIQFVEFFVPLMKMDRGNCNDNNIK